MGRSVQNATMEVTGMTHKNRCENNDTKYSLDYMIPALSILIVICGNNYIICILIKSGSMPNLYVSGNCETEAALIMQRSNPLDVPAFPTVRESNIKVLNEARASLIFSNITKTEEVERMEIHIRIHKILTEGALRIWTVGKVVDRILI